LGLLRITTREKKKRGDRQDPIQRQIATSAQPLRRERKEQKQRKKTTPEWVWGVQEKVAKKSLLLEQITITRKLGEGLLSGHRKMKRKEEEG